MQTTGNLMIWDDNQGKLIWVTYTEGKGPALKRSRCRMTGI